MKIKPKNLSVYLSYFSLSNELFEPGEDESM